MTHSKVSLRRFAQWECVQFIHFHMISMLIQNVVFYKGHNQNLCFIVPGITPYEILDIGVVKMSSDALIVILEYEYMIYCQIEYYLFCA